MTFATEEQARAAYEQFVWEPHPADFEETYPTWENLESGHRELWFRVANAVLQGKVIE